MELSIIEALQITLEHIVAWAKSKFATGLEVIDNKLYLKNINGVIEDSEVTLPGGSIPDFGGEVIFDCGHAPIVKQD